jgi:hypothetical protein
MGKCQRFLNLEIMGAARLPCIPNLNSVAGYPRRMQAAQLPMLSFEQRSDASVYGKSISQQAFCAGFLRGGIDSCQGDSGGPYACQVDGQCCSLPRNRSWYELTLYDHVGPLP